jgi:magnesium-protoporphyrin IX monomethyl ester (oxidative) cyclase
LVAHLGGERDVESVSNLAYMNGDGYTENARAFVEDLDALPLPARDLLPMEIYIERGLMHGETGHTRRATTLITSRGCPVDCVFCSIHPVWGYEFRKHSPAFVLREMESLERDFGITHFIFEDDNLSLHRGRAKEIFREMEARLPGASWAAPNGVAVFGLDDELLGLFKRTGCQRLSLAVESGCQSTLTEIIGKPIRLAQVDAVVRSCNRLGLKTTAFFVLGLPGETRETIAESMRYAARLPVSSLCIMAASPYPGTRLATVCDEGGYYKDGFEPDRLFTLNAQIETPEFTPEFVQGMIARTMFLHGLRHPGSVLRRLLEKLRVSPISTIFALWRAFERVTIHRLRRAGA